MREMKDSGVEWIGEIPRDWQLKRIKAVLCERNESNNPVKTDYILSLTNDRGVIPYSDKGDVGNKSKDDLTGYKLAYEGDIVLNSMNVIIGSVALSSYFGCVSPVYYMLYPRNHKHSVKFYNYLFQTNELQSKLKGYGNGIMEIRMRIQMSKLNTVEFPIPPSETQHRIADYLDRKCSKIDEIIKKESLVIEKLKAYKLSVITEAVTKGLNPDVPMKDSGSEWIGEIPKNWLIVKVKNISSLVTDGAHVSPETENGIYDFISTVNIEQDKIIFDNCLKTSEKSYQMLVASGCKPEMNDILISKDGTVGRTVIVDTESTFVISSSLVIIRPIIDIILPNFLNYNLQSNIVQKNLQMLMHGAGLRRVSVSKNANLPIIFAPIDEQQEISKYLDQKCTQIDETITKKQATIEKLKAYKKSLIYEVVTGKKEV